MKCFVLSIFLVFLAVIFLPNNADAICLYDVDWPEKPCYGCPSCYPGLEQERLDLNQYFKFKGEQ
ncbi:MAG: hypothetical protein WD512_08415 [Candidatus Paceibacterota bacterium]